MLALTFQMSMKKFSVIENKIWVGGGGGGKKPNLAWENGQF
jgi:hypothetical protein